MSGTLLWYHPASNEVTEYASPVSYEQFQDGEANENAFWIGIRTDGLMEVYTAGGEAIFLQKDKQTCEQAVILFATMLGLREAARE